MKHLWCLVSVSLIAGAVIVLGWRWDWFSTARSTSGPSSDVNDAAQTPHLVSHRYVGTLTCAKCHETQHKSYLTTAHSLAMSLVEPSREPADDEFHHKASGRRYRIYREAGLLRHAESLADSEGVPEEVGGPLGSIAFCDYPLKYLVGSGRHSRTYLIEQDGFLMESPVTWYSSTRKWGLSPGFDQSFHAGFERTADKGCLVCHAGRFSSGDRVYGRAEFRELAIGCERCHGPGSEHVQKWASAHMSKCRNAQVLE